MKEIGGYLELETLRHKEYYADAIPLNTARNAFVYLVKAKGIQKVYIPYYLCDSVSLVCDRECINYEFYHINEKFFPIFEIKLEENEYLYVVNYFGQLSSEDIEALRREYKNIIIDNVQAFFESPLSGVDTIYSCRKFFGVPDGAYLISEAKGLELDDDISKDRMSHVLGRYEGKSASDYYLDFQENDKRFEDLPLMYMSKLTHNILGAIDYESIIKKRNENWRLLQEGLGARNKLNLRTPNAPYMYPFYCKQGMELKKKLAEKKIFIPTLWPNVFMFTGCELEKDYAENILPLPIDQRYGEEEMERVLAEVVMYIDKE